MQATADVAALLGDCEAGFPKGVWWFNAAAGNDDVADVG